ncbi:MAG TPA: hypothetical protein VEV87_01980 [Chitinophagaceae bacterium]|nr:hypothetical protein [Chitinophagaceae bacterium]
MPRHTSGFDCENCGRDLRRSYSICPHCKFPIEGSEEEKELYYHRLEAAKIELTGLQEKVENARISLWIIALINLLYAIIFHLFNKEIKDAHLVLVINILASLIFILLGILAKEKPFSALTAGLILYVSLFIYRLVDGQPDMLIAALAKDILAVWLFKGISNTRTAEELKKQLSLSKKT